MTEKEREFLGDTHDILIGYDGCRTPEQLMELIDEIRERLSIVLNGNIERFEAEMEEKTRLWQEEKKKDKSM